MNLQSRSNSRVPGVVNDQVDQLRPLILSTHVETSAHPVRPRSNSIGGSANNLEILPMDIIAQIIQVCSVQDHSVPDCVIGDRCGTPPSNHREVDRKSV